uniref:Uncharacterized protein n=1 Tax=Candidatus Kentrum sp. TUN TaxID=2126343 RepID=A0A450ZUJ8_9GAMM|nr:MAG: hypothetical protein BECKTUN1418E_GA0071001_100537 [Candidatus Kentron sp. TUN]VFK57470.1 MAG: hypothetical protein BECKTUN1418F_GA0071002_11173 [Candidatus Kentron sp. TUN]
MGMATIRAHFYLPRAFEYALRLACGCIVCGGVPVASENVMNWLGVKNLDLAVGILDDQGIQDVSKSGDGATTVNSLVLDNRISCWCIRWRYSHFLAIRPLVPKLQLGNHLPGS